VQGFGGRCARAARRSGLNTIKTPRQTPLDFDSASTVSNGCHGEQIKAEIKKLKEKAMMGDGVKLALVAPGPQTPTPLLRPIP
jgi:hypothetical protein